MWTTERGTLIQATAHTHKHTFFSVKKENRNIIHGSNESIAIPGVLKLFKAVKDTLYIFQYCTIAASSIQEQCIRNQFNYHLNKHWFVCGCVHFYRLFCRHRQRQRRRRCYLIILLFLISKILVFGSFQRLCVVKHKYHIICWWKKER